MLAKASDQPPNTQPTRSKFANRPGLCNKRLKLLLVSKLETLVNSNDLAGRKVVQSLIERAAISSLQRATLV